MCKSGFTVHESWTLGASAACLRPPVIYGFKLAQGERARPDVMVSKIKAQGMSCRNNDVSDELVQLFINNVIWPNKELSFQRCICVDCMYLILPLDR